MEVKLVWNLKFISIGFFDECYLFLNGDWEMKFSLGERKDFGIIEIWVRNWWVK